MTRKEELLRERSLVAAHLAWLDLELARLEGLTPPVAEDAARPATAGPAVQLPVPQAPDLSAEGKALAERLGQEQAETTARSVGEVKRGCFLLFAAGLLLLSGALFLCYWFKYRR